jgi:hypothetical protein
LPTRKPKACVSKSRTVHTYAELWHGSRVLLERGEAEAKGSSWVYMSSLLLTAFTLEAYLNHIGQQLFTSWATLEVLSPLGKLEVVCEKLGLSFPADQRPRQSIDELFRFRNALAHGKTVTITEPGQLMDVDEYLDEFLGQRPRTLWEKLSSTSADAKRVREDVEQIICALHEAAKLENDPVFFPGMGSHSAKFEPDS